MRKNFEEFVARYQAEKARIKRAKLRAYQRRLYRRKNYNKKMAKVMRKRYRRRHPQTRAEVLRLIQWIKRSMKHWG